VKAVWCERERTNEGYWVGGRQQQGQQGQQEIPQSSYTPTVFAIPGEQLRS
jgi:hypothetical protein